MSLLKIAWRSIQHRGLSSTLTGLSMALGVALVVTVLVILNTVDNTFRRNAEGFHLIVGATKGGRMQLVLNALYHLSQPVENVPYDLYLEFAQKAEGVDAKALFKRLDANGDGKVSLTAEITKVESKRLVKLLCERADKTPDDVITPLEFSAVFVKPGKTDPRAKQKPYFRAEIDPDEWFKKLDANQDGKLSGEWTLPTDLHAIFQQKVSYEYEGIFFVLADRSSDGVLTQEDLSWVVGHKGFAHLKIDPLELFNKLDTNQDGKVTDERVLPRELQKAFSRPIVSPKEAEQFLSKADASRDGVVTREELEAALSEKPYVYADIVVEDFLAVLDADKDGRFPADSKLPEDGEEKFSEKRVKKPYAMRFFWKADKEGDDDVNLVELTRAVNGPGRYGRFVEIAIPYCLGDSYIANGTQYRVVGTTPQMFEVEYANGKYYEFAQGRNIHQDYLNEHHFFEAVIGSIVANQAGLKVGDQFQPTHGIKGDGHKHAGFTIVGVLGPTGTPNDRALFVNLEGFYVLDGHSKDGEHRVHVHGDHVHADRLPIEQREVTAVLIRTKDAPGSNADMIAQTIYTEINEGQVAQAAQPTKEVNLLFTGLVGNLKIILLILAVLIVVVAGIGIMVSIYNSMSERVRDIAVMRALGAGRSTVMLVVLLESSLLAFLGGLCGFVLGHGLIGWVLGPLFIEPQTGVTMRFFQFELYEALLIPGLIILSALAGFLPALAAYRTDVAKALSSAP